MATLRVGALSSISDVNVVADGLAISGSFQSFSSLFQTFNDFQSSEIERASMLCSCFFKRAFSILKASKPDFEQCFNVVNESPRSASEVSKTRLDSALTAIFLGALVLDWTSNAPNLHPKAQTTSA